MKRTTNRSRVSHAPFAVVNKKDVRCPACGWSPSDGGAYGCGIRTSLRIHCYREHGLRLRLGDRKRVPPDPAAGIDLDAEAAAHMWVVDHALRQFDPPPGDDVMQEARMALLAAILLWDRQKCVSFCNYASKIIRQKAAAAVSTGPPPPAGRPLRVMLPPPPDPADAPSVTASELAEAMRRLPDVQRRVLGCLFAETPMTFDAMGKSMGVSKDCIRRIRIKALRRLRAEMTGEGPESESGPLKPRRRCPPPWSGPPRPGRFVVLLDGAPTRMDRFGTLRSPGPDVSVFTDRRIAARLAHNLKARLRKGERGRVSIADAAEATGFAEVVVDALPLMKWPARKAMTIDAIRDKLAQYGPMTALQIARRLMDCEKYMTARHPDAGEESVLATVRRYLRCMPSLRQVRRRRAPAVYSVPAA